MINLRAARFALRCMTGSERKDYKIGRITGDFDGLAGGGYRENEIVLYRVDDDGTVTLERPDSKEQIKKNKQRGTTFVSHSTIINVPVGYVEEVRI